MAGKFCLPAFYLEGMLGCASSFINMLLAVKNRVSELPC